jgi:glycosyltransferase involved in cell wall biosynthesis
MDLGPKRKNTLISIVIATYNAGSQLQECLASIDQQAYDNIEILIIDGGSTDNTIEIVKKFSGRKSITWLTEKDQGIYDALNKGIKLAKGDWLYFMGADDRLLPGFSELASKLKDPNTIYYGNTHEKYDPENKPSFTILTGEFSKYRLAKYCINHQAIIYPASAFEKYGYNVKYKVFADYALNLALWGDNNFNREHHSLTIVSYDMTGFSSLNEDIVFKQEKAALIKMNLGWIIYLRFMLKKLKKRKRGETDFD